jgi:Ni/Co efflux regulator RcnB
MRAIFDDLQPNGSNFRYGQASAGDPSLSTDASNRRSHPRRPATILLSMPFEDFLMNATTPLLLLLAALVAATASANAQAADRGDRVERRLDQRGDRIDRQLDRKGDRIDEQLDRRAERAENNGKYGLATRLDNRGDRIENKYDQRGDRTDNRLDRKGEKFDARWDRRH